MNVPWFSSLHEHLEFSTLYDFVPQPQRPPVNLQPLCSRALVSSCAWSMASALLQFTSLGFLAIPRNCRTTAPVNPTEAQTESTTSRATFVYPKSTGSLGQSSPAGWHMLTPPYHWIYLNQLQVRPFITSLLHVWDCTHWVNYISHINVNL